MESEPRMIRCRKCRQMYGFFGTPAEVSYCPECLLSDKELAEKIKAFVSQNAQSSVNDIMKEFGVSLPKLKEYLKVGYVAIEGDQNNFVLCEKCSLPINSGQYCGACAQKGGKKDDPLVRERSLSNVRE